jgi:alpha-beta hydrolase superfamily lysophospholipase
LDRRGSGLNEKGRGDAQSYQQLIEDVAEFIGAELDRLSVPAPVFLLAISWGGKLALALQREFSELVQGIVLICPGLFPKVRPSLRERLLIARSRLFAPARLFPIPLSDPALFTSTPTWQQYIRDDPLGLRQASARLLVESVRLDRLLRSIPGYVRVPVLLLLAEKDLIIDNAKTRRFVEKFATGDKEIIEYPAAHHTLEFEPDPDNFIKDIERWLERRLRHDQEHR